MKTTWKILLSIVAIAFLIACQKRLPQPLPDVEAPTSAAFTAEVHIDKPAKGLDSTNLNSSPKVVYTGNGGSNLFSSFGLTLIHSEDISETGHFSIFNGTFSLVDEAGNSLSGTYSGTGTKTGLRMTHEWILTSGVGKYGNHEGSFTAVFADDENDGSFRGQVFGILREKGD